MAKSYSDYQKEIESLQKAAESLRKKEVAGVIDRIKTAIETYKLSARDLGFGSGAVKPAPKGKKVRRSGKSTRAAAYRDDAGNTWSGRGRRPGWLNTALAAGKRLEDLRA